MQRNTVCLAPLVDGGQRGSARVPTSHVKHEPIAGERNKKINDNNVYSTTKLAVRPISGGHCDRSMLLACGDGDERIGMKMREIDYRQQISGEAETLKGRRKAPQESRR